MRIKIAGDLCDEEVIAEPFEIEGSGEQFAVHRAIDGDIEAEKKRWTASHIETGFAVGRGDSIDEAIDHARTLWLSKTPEEIERAKLMAWQRKATRDTAQPAAA